MEFYKPLQRLPYYVYDKHANNVSIKSSITVYLNTGESLVSQNTIYNPTTHSAAIQFDHLQDAAQVAPYYYLHDSLIEIIANVGIPYDPLNEAAFKNALRAAFASYYTVKVIVNDKPGIPDTGGQASNSISNTAEIGIV